MEALVLAGMIAHQLGIKIAKLIKTKMGRARLSYEKLYDSLANYLVRVISFKNLINFKPDPRHITRDRRTGQSPIESGLKALT